MQTFADPDPFRQLSYASQLDAKRAIAQYLGRALATLPADQLVQINAIVGTTLSRQEELAQVRAYVESALKDPSDAE